MDTETDRISGHDWQKIDQFVALVHFWSECRARHGGQFASRGDVKPHAIKDFLHWTFIADSMGYEELTVRLSAAAIDDAISNNLTNTNMFDLYEPEMKSMFWRFVTPILAGDLGGYASRILVGKWDQQIQYQSICLPLRNRDGTQNAMLGAVHWTPMEQEMARRLGKTDETPENFGRVTSMMHLTLDTFEPVPFDTEA
ncbi:MAG: hypothetical protein COB37_06520 [Kordiimonadales bacterium]|nr:MAG: hypothetical protein COB37_06520 [Kordiimonadales bacterium]